MLAENKCPCGNTNVQERNHRFITYLIASVSYKTFSIQATYVPGNAHHQYTDSITITTSTCVQKFIKIFVSSEAKSPRAENY